MGCTEGGITNDEAVREGVGVGEGALSFKIRTFFSRGRNFF